MNIPLQQYLDLFSSYLRPQWRRAALLAVLLFTGIGLQLINPQIMRSFIDSAKAADGPAALGRVALLFIAVALGQQVVAVLATYTGENVGWTATNSLRADLARHCLRLDMSFHNAHTPGEMIERLDGDVTALANFFSQFVIQVFGNLVLMAGIVLLLLREDWRVGLALAAFALLSLLALARLRNVAVTHWTAARQAYADLFGFLEERLAGSEDIRACGAKAYIMRRFHELLRGIMGREMAAGLMASVMTNTGTLLWSVGPALAFAVGAYVFRAGAITIGTVYLIFNYSAMLTGPMQLITQQLQDLQQAGAGIVRIRELLRTPSRVEDGRGIGLPGGALAVEFAGVSFRYGQENVLTDLRFQLAPGRVLGLLGRTGSGKTTVTRLLFRLYDPQAGAIRLGGVDVRQARLRELRARVGMVTQNVELFHATVRDNLTFFDPTITDKAILAAIDRLGLELRFRTLPQGLDTVLEAGGGGLSTGEAQLLAFTRLFLRDPGLVILDEASSRLDPATEALIERAVAELLAGRTGIIIAHRLATIERADEIMILEDGRIRECGERRQLAVDPASRFYHLLQTGLEEVLA